ncbi:DUF1028 domain-containing protein [Sedimentitalea nanhaiensis]|uniref:Uncharacterized conserved protein, Ntn-hydrolase superfamily n=1 Tax=Sedimentitalea nanhaiensis TaxID=999627 RepID=A0A1I7BH24_9RHOB|nr:DUF1028 domain-containing protein [Sedimentitalea nanhaiensis]SFT86480.1 Uncharacterized conserved protein, Ntn-hydrolase superfamily [Sedimentitalea nanhaiensis]
MTWSIIARDPADGAIGIAVASRFFACGAAVPYVGRRSAVASQAFCNPVWGTEGRNRLEAGEEARTVLDDLVARDAGQAIRQCHMMDASGRFAAHTGSGCTDWAGHLIGDGFCVAGNMLTGSEVIEATAAAFAAHSELPFAHRLLAAMHAGEDAGGDKRGKQAAGLTIHRGQAHPWLDLRADDHGDPLTELDRLLDVAGERYLFVADEMPTAERFSGLPTRTELDTRIDSEQKRRQQAGQASRSLASDP